MDREIQIFPFAAWIRGDTVLCASLLIEITTSPAFRCAHICLAIPTWRKGGCSNCIQSEARREMRFRVPMRMRWGANSMHPTRERWTTARCSQQGVHAVMPVHAAAILHRNPVEIANRLLSARCTPSASRGAASRLALEIQLKGVGWIGASSSTPLGCSAANRRRMEARCEMRDEQCPTASAKSTPALM